MKSNSNYQWMKTVMSKGTVSDKVAAYTVTIQDSPVSNLETLRSLVGMVKVGKKREYIVVIGKPLIKNTDFYFLQTEISIVINETTIVLHFCF